MFNKNNNLVIKNDEELRKRKKQKLIFVCISIVLVVSFIVLIITGSLSNLMGNSVIEYYCNDSAYSLDGTNCVKKIVKKSFVLADVNLDDKIDSDDLNILNNYVKDEKSVNLSEIQLKVSDINLDGMISELDVQILEGYFTKVAGTSASNSERIGIERFCETGYTLNGDKCEKTETIPAIRKYSSIDNDINENNLDNTNENSIDANTNENNVNDNSNNEMPVITTFKPESNTTRIVANKKYRLSINFDIKDTSKDYYYVWRSYSYGVNNYSTSCTKVVAGDHYGSFTMDGTKQVIVTVYGDSNCKEQVSSVESKKYECIGCTNMVNATLKPQDNKTTLDVGTKYNLKLAFDIKDKTREYYYVWSNYSYGKVTYKTQCKKITEGEHSGSFTMDGTKKAVVTLYMDPNCSSKIKQVESKVYSCKGCTNQVNVKYRYDDLSDIGYQPSHFMYEDRKFFLKDGTVKYFQHDDISYYDYTLPNSFVADRTYTTIVREIENIDDLTEYINLKTYHKVYNNLTYYTKKAAYDSYGNKPELKNYKNIDVSSFFKEAVIGVSFEINDASRQYYYTWQTYDHYGKKAYSSTCQKVNSKENIKTLTMKGNRYGSISIYSDSSCKNKIKTTNTKKLKMITLTYCSRNCPEELVFPGAYVSVSQYEKLTGDAGYSEGTTYTVVKKGTKVTVRGKIEIINYKKNYYYRWKLRSFDKNSHSERYISNCTKAIDNKIVSTSATITSRFATVNLEVFDTSDCSNNHVNEDYRAFLLNTTCKKAIANPIYSRNDVSSKYYYINCKS